MTVFQRLTARYPIALCQGRICHEQNKKNRKSYNGQETGAPDWIIEVVSPGTKRMDYGIKLFKYRTAGVREYWIVNPLNRTVNVYDLITNELTDLYSFDDDIPVCIYGGLKINFTDLLGWNYISKNIMLILGIIPNMSITYLETQ